MKEAHGFTFYRRTSWQKAKINLLPREVNLDKKFRSSRSPPKPYISLPFKEVRVRLDAIPNDNDVRVDVDPSLEEGLGRAVLTAQDAEFKAKLDAIGERLAAFAKKDEPSFAAASIAKEMGTSSISDSAAASIVKEMGTRSISDSMSESKLTDEDSQSKGNILSISQSIPKDVISDGDEVEGSAVKGNLQAIDGEGKGSATPEDGLDISKQELINQDEPSLGADLKEGQKGLDEGGFDPYNSHVDSTNVFISDHPGTYHTRDDGVAGNGYFCEVPTVVKPDLGGKDSSLLRSCTQAINAVPSMAEKFNSFPSQPLDQATWSKDQAAANTWPLSSRSPRSTDGMELGPPLAHISSAGKGGAQNELHVPLSDEPNDFKAAGTGPSHVTELPLVKHASTAAPTDQNPALQRIYYGQRHVPIGQKDVQSAAVVESWPYTWTSLAATGSKPINAQDLRNQHNLADVGVGPRGGNVGSALLVPSMSSSLGGGSRAQTVPTRLTPGLVTLGRTLNAHEGSLSNNIDAEQTNNGTLSKNLGSDDQFKDPTGRSWAELFIPASQEFNGPNTNPDPNRLARDYDSGSPVSQEEFNLEYVDHGEKATNLVLKIPKDITTAGKEEWRTTLVGRFLGKKLPYSLVINATERFWAKEGLIDTLATDSGYFFFMFSSEETRDAVMEGGPWFIAGQPLLLRPWKPLFSFGNKEVQTIPIWVNFYGVPLELWNPRGISFISSFIEKPIRVDRTTASRRRITYARVCIEVTADFDFFNDFHIESEDEVTGENIRTKISLDYQWTPVRCKQCSEFGHDCSRVANPATRPTAHYPYKKNGKTEGEWQVVEKKDKGKKTVDCSSHHTQKMVSSVAPLTRGNMFDALTQLQEESGTGPIRADSITHASDPIMCCEASSSHRPDVARGEVREDPTCHTSADDDDEGEVVYSVEDKVGLEARGSPLSNRQKKKEAKMNFSGSRPKSRHRS